MGKGEEKVEVTNGEDAEKIRAALEESDWMVRSVDKKERRRNAAPPFTTSKLQQDSSRKLRFSVKRTMMIAQRLYEGVELGEEGSIGLITYMRTDWSALPPKPFRKFVNMSAGNTVRLICRRPPMLIKKRKMRRALTRRFVQLRPCAILTRSSST